MDKHTLETIKKIYRQKQSFMAENVEDENSKEGDICFTECDFNNGLKAGYQDIIDVIDMMLKNIK